MEFGAGRGGGGWVLPDPCSAEEELPKKEGVVPGGWAPHLLETAAENNENPCVNEEKAELDKNEEKENPDTKFSWNACSQW